MVLCGCTGDHKGKMNNEITFTATHPRQGDLFDSIHDLRLREITGKDSIELLAVHHVVEQGEAVEQILYLDRSAARLDKLRSESNGFGPMEFDSGILRHNPLPAMTGSYVQVFSYKGQYMMANVGDRVNSEQMVVTDSAIVWIPNGFNLLYYKSGQQSGNIVTYVVADEQRKSTDTIQIKMLGGSNKMQLWRWPHEYGSNYVMMMPIENLGDVPEINAHNSKSLDGNMDVAFDRINYDSIMNSK